MLDKEKFSKLFNNRVLKDIVFSNVKKIHIENYKSKNRYGWDQMVKEPSLLVYHNYIEEIKQLPLESMRIKKMNGDLLYFAIRYDRDDLIQYFTTSPVVDTIEWDYRRAFAVTALTTNPKVFKSILARVDLKEMMTDRDMSLNVKHAVMFAASRSRMDIIESILAVLTRDIFVADNFIITGGIHGGHLEVIKHYYDNQYINLDPESIHSFLDNCVSYDHLEIFKYLQEKGIDDISWSAISSALLIGNLEMIKYLYTQYPDMFVNINSINKAATNGHLEVVKWLHETLKEGYSIDAIENATKNGHMDVVAWLNQNYTKF